MICEPTDEVKYFHANRTTWKITKFTDGLWRDALGCVYALADKENSVDDVSRCGVGIFSLPANHPANDGCRAHDYKYSSTAYQLYHSRKEADLALEQDLRLLGYSTLGIIFKRLSRYFGAKYWERKETR